MSVVEAMNKRLKTNPLPHLRRGITTQQVMLHVIIALIPACIGAVYYFGWLALIQIAAAVLSAVLAEWIFQKVTGTRIAVGDLSAVVTGILLALNLPVTAPIWLFVVGSVFSIIIAKQLFGGIGQNFINPALAGRAFLQITWPAMLSSFIAPEKVAVTGQHLLKGVDAVSAATPLATGTATSYMDLFTGNIAGSMGEISAMLILLGGLYLLVMGVIRWHIPVIYIATTALLTWAFGGAGLFAGDPLRQVLSGGLLLGAVFMATDYASTPATRKGQIIFALGCGVLTAVIRLWGGYPEGVCYSILIMNALSPLIERLTLPRVYGTGKSKRVTIHMGGQ